MNLSARERQALRSIEGGLTESDPDLVAKLATLSRLMADEDRPAAKRSRAGWRHVVIGSLVRWLPGSRGHGHTSTQSWWGSAMLALWLAMTCASDRDGSGAEPRRYNWILCWPDAGELRQPRSGPAVASRWPVAA